MHRRDVFLRDGNRCVYCGQVFEIDELTVDHVQPRMRLGDASGGNLVTACRPCNVRKGSRRLAQFLACDSTARENFFRYAQFIWPRHRRALEEELRTAGSSDAT
jgi:5-methylcytosine-specific restriction endonuclease McrA